MLHREPSPFIRMCRRATNVEMTLLAGFAELLIVFVVIAALAHLAGR